MHVRHTTGGEIVAEMITTREGVGASIRTSVTTIVRTVAAGVETVIDALVVEEGGDRITVDSMVGHTTDAAVVVVIRDTRITTGVGVTELEGELVLVVVSRRVITSTSNSNHKYSNNGMLVTPQLLNTGKG
jgi:hypothetical protein